ncbi:hypothetical protein DMENIID0001_027730 [Sergentomyia squamirostris]
MVLCTSENEKNQTFLGCVTSTGGSPDANNNNKNIEPLTHFSDSSSSRSCTFPGHTQSVCFTFFLWPENRMALRTNSGQSRKGNNILCDPTVVLTVTTSTWTE